MHVKSASYCLAVMALLVIGSTIEAQDQGQRQGRGNRGAGQQRMSRSALLRVEVVQDELDISEEQLADLSKLRGQGRGGGERAARAAAAWASGPAWLAHGLRGVPGAASRHTRGEAVADEWVLVPEVLPLLLRARQLVLRPPRYARRAS